MTTPIITSLLDTDAYKFPMWQAFLHSNPGAVGKHLFLCRNTPALPLARLKAEVEAQLDALCELRFTPEELEYLATWRYLKPSFVDYLELFHLRRKHIHVEVQGDKLAIYSEGPLVSTMPFEIYVLSIVNELHFRALASDEVMAEGQRRLDVKLGQLAALTETPQERNPFVLSDFGTRRRFSRAWQEHVVQSLLAQAKTMQAAGKPVYFRGTSNVDLARRYQITAVGTMAHEYLQAFQGFGGRLRNFQKAALETWVQEFRGDLGIALTDVVGMDAFLEDFDLYFAKLFDGLRHDSGDPFVWGEKALAHYAKLRIDASTKRLVFSDGLDFERAFKLWRCFGARTQTLFGIGTWLSNDMGVEPLQIVMKLLTCNGQPTAKLSDSPGKTMCDNATFLAYLRQQFNVA